VAELDIQYRMSDDIMSLSNLLVYNGKLRAADARVASQRLSLSIAPSQWPGLTTLLAASFLRALLEPDRRVVFLDTDALRPGASLEARSDGATSNPTEAAIVAECARAFLAGGLDPAELGVIAPYNAQVMIAVEQRRLYQTATRHGRSGIEQILMAVHRLACWADVTSCAAGQAHPREARRNTLRVGAVH
jgi:DNA replication ATP-dependent helicase Dna2